MVDPRTALRVAVLGPCLVEHDGQDVTPSSALQRRMLTLLAVRSPGPASAESLMDVAWSGAHRPKDPRQNLHTHMSRLRRHLDERTGGPGAITTEANGYRLDPDAATTDLRELAELTDPATADDRRGERLDRALALWRGPSLADIVDSDHGIGEATRLDELRCSLLEARFERLLTRDLDLASVAELEAYTIEHPYRERPHAILMEVLYRLGRQADALRTYRRLSTRLGEDLGLEPSTTLRELESQVLMHQLPQRGSPPPTEPPVTGTEAAEAPSRAPTAVTALLGRADELELLHAAVERSRVVTVTGPGGVGKTRLAMELAHQLGQRDVQRAVVWCDLTTAVSATDVVDAVALALTVRRRGTQTARQAVLLAACTGPVLILDNCEQVADHVAALVVDLLSAGPVQVLTTARAPLDLPGEELVRVRPMSWHRSTASSEAPPAVALFCERAAAAGSEVGADARDCALVSKVCQAVDGLPLGIELAAAQLRNMTLEELAERVGATSGALDVERRSGAHRHRSIRSALAWSLDSLDGEERELFCAISVFPGSFDARAAAAVLDAGEVAVAPRLRSLADLSLVTVESVGGRSRFRLLQTARRMGQERAEIGGRASTFRARHRRWVLDLVRESQPLLRGPGEPDAVRSIELEMDSIRSVVRSAAHDGDGRTTLDVVAPLCDFAVQRLRDDVIDWAQLALTLDGADEHPQRAAAMAMIALAMTNRGDLATAHALAGRVLEMDEAQTNAVLVALHALALVALYSGALVDAVEIASREMDVAAAADEPFHGQMACLVAGLAEVYGGATDRAMEWVERSSELAERSGAPTSAAWASYLLGEVFAGVDPLRSASSFRAAIATASSVNNQLVTGVARLSLTTLPLEAGHEHEALEAYGQLIEGWRARNDWTHQWTTLQNLAPLLARCGADEDAAVLLGALTTDERRPHLFGDTAEELAVLHSDLADRLGGDETDALRSIGAALTPPQTLGHALVAIEGVLDGGSRAAADSVRSNGGQTRSP